MSRRLLLGLLGLLLPAASGFAITPTPYDIIMNAGDTPAGQIHGAWAKVADATAGGGYRIHTPNANAATVAASANPTDYFDIHFNAPAGVPYRVWVRLKAQSDSYNNDSVHVQFTNSVDKDGNPIYRTTSATSMVFTAEESPTRGLSGWAWADSNTSRPRYVGNAVLFATSGQQTIRISKREDGCSVDQIILSPTYASFFGTCPGLQKADTTPPYPTNYGSSGGGGEVVLYASNATIPGGSVWTAASDATAAGGAHVIDPNTGQPKVEPPLASPPHYFEMTFNANAGVPYRLWMRLRATGNTWSADSVWVQFNQSVDSGGNPIFRIGTTSGTWVSLEEYANQGVQGWGWADNGYGALDTPGQLIYFSQSGQQTIRVQRREDGVMIDQIVLSPGTYLNTKPGPQKNDTTILPASSGGSLSAPPADPQLRVVQANIHKSRSTAEGGTYPELTASELAMFDATVIGLNECVSPLPDQIKPFLEAKTGVTWYKYGVGNVIFSRIPLDATETNTLPHGGSAVRGQFQFGGKTINFVVTHLSSVNATERAAQISDLVPWLNGMSENRILVGDMNTTSTSELSTIRAAFYDSWEITTSGNRVTYPDNTAGRTRSNRIDYIYRSKNSPDLTNVSFGIPDLRDKFTYTTTNGQNAAGDYLAAGIYKGSPSMILNTKDDMGIRPSDHNWIWARFDVAP